MLQPSASGRIALQGSQVPRRSMNELASYDSMKGDPEYGSDTCATLGRQVLLWKGRAQVTDTPSVMPASVDELQATLRNELYVADRGLAMSIYLALTLKRPLFLEGEAGVGKTEVARALASALDARLIRLQCYEGLDVNQAVYEWNYSRQLLHIRLLEAQGGVDRKDAERELFSEEFLIKRPLLQALRARGRRCFL